MVAIDFDVESHRDFITRRGEQVGWRLGRACPCQDPLSRLHDRSCALCGGTGRLFELQDTGDYRALIRQVDERKDFARFGQIYLGDITITTMPDEIPVGEGDWVDLVTRRFRHEEVVQADGSATTPLSWKPAAELVAVRSLDVEYVSAVDVALASSQEALTWLGTPPALGTRLSLVYDWNPRYLVLPGMVTSRRAVDGTRMPQRVVGRLWNREDFRE